MEIPNERNSSDDDLEELDLTTCPNCYRITSCSPASTAVSPLHPNSISTAHTTFEDWKKEINEAIKFRLDGSMHDVVKVLLLTWQANGLGSKSPAEKGSLILEETLALERVFRDYGYSTQHYQIPSTLSQISVQIVLNQIILDLERDP